MWFLAHIYPEDCMDIIILYNFVVDSKLILAVNLVFFFDSLRMEVKQIPSGASPGAGWIRILEERSQTLSLISCG